MSDSAREGKKVSYSPFQQLGNGMVVAEKEQQENRVGQALEAVRCGDSDVQKAQVTWRQVLANERMGGRRIARDVVDW